MRNSNQILDKKQMVNSSYEVQFFIGGIDKEDID